MKKNKMFMFFIITIYITCITQCSFGANFVWSSDDTVETSVTQASEPITDNTNSLKLESGSAILIEQNSRSNFI